MSDSSSYDSQRVILYLFAENTPAAIGQCGHSGFHPSVLLHPLAVKRRLGGRKGAMCSRQNVHRGSKAEVHVLPI